ncbi:hypothetical protein D3C72_1353990 [compost metagenome]
MTCHAEAFVAEGRHQVQRIGGDLVDGVRAGRIAHAAVAPAVHEEVAEVVARQPWLDRLERVRVAEPAMQDQDRVRSVPHAMKGIGHGIPVQLGESPMLGSARQSHRR